MVAREVAGDNRAFADDSSSRCECWLGGRLDDKPRGSEVFDRDADRLENCGLTRDLMTLTPSGEQWQGLVWGVPSQL